MMRVEFIRLKQRKYAFYKNNLEAGINIYYNIPFIIRNIYGFW